MTIQFQKSLCSAATLSALLLMSACEDGNRPARLSGVETGPRVFNSPPLPSRPGMLVLDNSPVPSSGSMTLVWSDEFDGAQLDSANWLIQTGDGTNVGLPSGWGNNELQYYQADNVQVSNGMLVITAREESVGGKNYTSARITTQDRVAFRFGRVEARIRLPGGQGTWPAFWMLSQDSAYGSWAATGEIDVLEATNLGVGGKNSIIGTLHYGGEAPNNTFTSNEYFVPADATAIFHDYAIEWDPTEIRWYVDGVLYAMQNSWFSAAADYPAPFDQAFHILLNVAVGGNLPGAPDASTQFPVTMEVDWVKIYSGGP